jgi:hypothetical protein
VGFELPNQYQLIFADELSWKNTEQTEALKPFSSLVPSVPLFPFVPYSLYRLPFYRLVG